MIINYHYIKIIFLDKKFEKFLSVKNSSKNDSFLVLFMTHQVLNKSHTNYKFQEERKKLVGDP